MIPDVQGIVVFLGIKVFNFYNSYMFPCFRNAQVTLVEKPQLKIISVNWALPSLHEGSLEITHTVPLKVNCLIILLKTINILLLNLNYFLGSRKINFVIFLYLMLLIFKK